MIHVSLSKARIEQCRVWAAQRSSQKRASTKQLNPEYDFIGVLAEECFGLLIGQPGPRFDPSFRDAGYDFKTAVGTVDVKGVGPKAPRDLFVLAVPLKADFYAVVYVGGLETRPYANVFGFARQAEVAAVAPTQGLTLSHRLEPEKLYDAVRLINEIRRRDGRVM